MFERTQVIFAAHSERPQRLAGANEEGQRAKFGQRQPHGTQCILETLLDGSGRVHEQEHGFVGSGRHLTEMGGFFVHT
jgi:hypothetical protein